MLDAYEMLARQIELILNPAPNVEQFASRRRGT